MNLVVEAEKAANYPATSLLSSDLASFLGPVLLLPLPLFLFHFLLVLFTLLVYQLIVLTRAHVCVCNIYIYYLVLFFKTGFQDINHMTQSYLHFCVMVKCLHKKSGKDSEMIVHT